MYGYWCVVDYQTNPFSQFQRAVVDGKWWLGLVTEKRREYCFLYYFRVNVLPFTIVFEISVIASVLFYV